MQTVGYTRLTRKGQITLPANIRKLLDIKEGDHIEVILDDDGVITVETARSIVARTAGSLKSNRGPFSDEEIREALAADAADRYLRKQ